MEDVGVQLDDDESEFPADERGAVSSAWLVPNRDGDLVPQGLGDDPTEEAMAKAGGRKVLNADFFVTPSPMPGRKHHLCAC
jgi:hypothetical protein